MLPKDFTPDLLDDPNRPRPVEPLQPAKEIPVPEEPKPPPTTFPAHPEPGPTPAPSSDPPAPPDPRA
jgi:hypothetical protein